MTAATEDKNLVRRDGQSAGISLAATAVLFAGTFVCLNVAGAGVAGADTAGYRFVGIAIESADAVDDEDETVEVYVDGVYLVTGSGFAATDVGKPVYLIDDQTVGLANHASVDQHILVGFIEEYKSATEVWVRIVPVGKRGPLGEVRQYTIEATGVNAAAFDLATQAAAFGGADFYIQAVQAVRSYVTATGAGSVPERKVTATHWTLANGDLTTVGDETANTWTITFKGFLT